jgi:enterobactin synthetase component D
MSVFTSPFPPSIAFTILTTTERDEFSLLPDEAALLSERAVDKRRSEFLLGREAAHRALEQLGRSVRTPILKGKHREPLWPEGFCGSITHAGDLAAAAAAPLTQIVSLGLDIEQILPDRGTSVRAVIGSADECAWIEEQPDLINFRSLLLFSAKESLYKAIFPFCKSFLPFSVAEMKPLSSRSLSVKLDSQLLVHYPALADLDQLSVQWQEATYAGDRYLLTSLYITALKKG